MTDRFCSACAAPQKREVATDGFVGRTHKVEFKCHSWLDVETGVECQSTGCRHRVRACILHAALDELQIQPYELMDVIEHVMAASHGRVLRAIGGEARRLADDLRLPDEEHLGLDEREVRR